MFLGGLPPSSREVPCSGFLTGSGSMRVTMEDDSSSVPLTGEDSMLSWVVDILVFVTVTRLVLLLEAAPPVVLTVVAVNSTGEVVPVVLVVTRL